MSKRTRQITERHPDHDTARILPRFRDRAVMLAKQREATARAITESVGNGTARRVDHNPNAIPDPGDLRGIPVIANGVGGTSPGTDPLRETVRRSRRRRVVIEDSSRR